MTKRRSQHWFGGNGKDAFIHRSWMKNGGLPDDAFDGRPVIGICNTFSEFTPRRYPSLLASSTTRLCVSSCKRFAI